MSRSKSVLILILSLFWSLTNAMWLFIMPDHSPSSISFISNASAADDKFAARPLSV